MARNSWTIPAEFERSQQEKDQAQRRKTVLRPLLGPLEVLAAPGE